MGLREKVALLVIVITFAQVIFGQSVQLRNKLKSNKIRKNAKAIPKHITTQESINRIYNFPEVEYPAPMKSTKFFNQNLDLKTYQVPKLSSLQSSSKTDRLFKNTRKSRKKGYKRNSKVYNGVINTIPKVSLPTPFSEFTTMPKPLGSEDDFFFPPVEYPLYARDLWTSHYWNRVPKFGPEIKINEEDWRVNTKATKKVAKIFKEPQDSFNQIKSFKDTTQSLVIGQTLTTMQPTSFCNENIYFSNEFQSVSQVTPSPIEKSPCYCTESIKTTPLPFIFSPLTTMSPTSQTANECVYDIKDALHSNILNLSSNISHCNITRIDENKDENTVDDESQLADEMGYTIMNPEVLSSFTTSTISPLDTDIADNTWMYPELDNHTFNTYSDDMEPCYILVP